MNFIKLYQEKDLRLLEASANIYVEVKTVKCSLTLPEALDVFYS